MTLNLHHRTPTLSAIDPRGRPVVTVAYYGRLAGTTTETRTTRQSFDAAGRLAAQWDARLWPADESEVHPNRRTRHSLSGQALRIDSVDAGWHMALCADAGPVLEGWDGRGTRRRTKYDEQWRPVSVFEKTMDRFERCVERLTYGDSTEAATNGCGRTLRHDDPAVSRSFAGHGLLGQDLTQTQRFLDALDTPDWPEPESERDALLETDDRGMSVSYTTRWVHDALGVPIGQTDAAGNAHITRYDVSGKLSQASLKGSDESLFSVLLDSIEYDVFGQVTSQQAGNGVTTTTTCSAVDGRLLLLRASRADEVLQDLRYTYDPVGNALTIEDAATPTDWFNGEEVNPLSEYRYDTLYQLIQATGRENAQQGTGITDRRRNYTETYVYDAGGNLLTLAHTQATPQTMKVDGRSNRSLPMPDESCPPDIERGFDANGNQLTLEGAQAMAWDARNQLQRVTHVARVDGIDDDEVYAYGADGQRCRKLRVRQAKAIEHIAQVKYLPGLEIRTNTASGEELHISTVEAGRIGIRRLYWRKGPATLPAAHVRYSIHDHLGSSSLELDSNAGVISHEGYYPYGGTAWWAARAEVEASYKTVRYSGKERDATGLYYYGFRYYAPWLHRWLNPDPAGDIDGLNAFGFVGNSPIMNIDADGRGLDQVPGLVRTHLLKWAEDNYHELPPDEWRRQLREKIKPHVPSGKDKVVDEIQRLVSQAGVRKGSSSRSSASSSRPSTRPGVSEAMSDSASDVNERAHQLMWKANFRIFQAAAESMVSNMTSHFTARFDSGTLDTIRGFHGAQGIFDSVQGRNKGPLKDAVKSLMKASPIEVAWSFNAMLIANVRESDATLYRGTAMSPEGLSSLQRITASGGMPLQTTRFLATSSDINVARRFSQMDAGVPVLFHIRGWAQHMGGEAAEREHLFPYGAVFLVERLNGNEFRMTYKKSARPIGVLPH